MDFSPHNLSDIFSRGFFAARLRAALFSVFYLFPLQICQRYYR